MKRILPVALAVFVAGGLLSGFLGLSNLTYAVDRPNRAGGWSADASAQSEAETVPHAGATPAPTATPVVSAAGVSIVASAAEKGSAADTATASGWSFLYVLGGDLWVAEGGTQFQLTQGAQISQPALLDDALAFVERQRNAADIWLTSADIPLRPITHNSSQIVSQNHWATQPVFVPGQQRLFVVGDFNKSSTGPGNLAVWEMSIQENAVVQITQPPEYAGGDQDITVNPVDPHQIVFTRYAYDSTRLVEQLYWTDVTRKSPMPVSQPDTPSRQASYSPDGSSVAFIQATPGTTDQDLWTARLEVPPDGPQLQDPHLAVRGIIANPVWSPDGAELAYIALAKDQFQVWTVAVNRDTAGSIVSFGRPKQLTGGASVDATSRPVYMTREQAARVRDWLSMASAHS